VVVFGADGVFAEERMGCPGMLDPTGRGHQAAVESVPRRVAWRSAGAAVLDRCRLATGAQLCVLPLAAWWTGTFDIDCA
jgi:hypothetical protein